MLVQPYPRITLARMLVICGPVSSLGQEDPLSPEERWALLPCSFEKREELPNIFVSLWISVLQMYPKQATGQCIQETAYVLYVLFFFYGIGQGRK